MARFPRPDMVADGESKTGVVAQTPNYTSRADGRPIYSIGTFAQMDGQRRTPNQRIEHGAVFGLEELGWESPVDPNQWPSKPNKVAW